MNSRKHGLVYIISLTVFLVILSNYAFAHGMSEAEKQSIIDGGNMAYMWLGATHMLSGYDHLAFVFGIIFFLTTFRHIGAAKYRRGMSATTQQGVSTTFVS